MKSFFTKTKLRQQVTFVTVILVVVGGLAFLTNQLSAPLPQLPHFGTTNQAQICGQPLLNQGPSTQPTVGGLFDPSGDPVVAVNSTMSNIGGGQLPANTLYWFASRTYNASTSGQVFPGNGDIFIGAPGAVIDGMHETTSGGPQSWLVSPEFGPGHTASGVTVEYLTIKGFNPAPGNGAINGNAGPNWTFKYLTLTQNAPGVGILLGAGNVASYNCLTQNGDYGANVYLAPGNSSNPVDKLTGGAFNVTLTYNEISFNDTCDFEAYTPFPNGVTPPAACGWVGNTPQSGVEYSGCGCAGGIKFWETNGATVVGNYVHDNEDTGVWADTDNTGFTIQNNYFYNNWGIGLWYEISYNANIQFNTFARNGIGIGPVNSQGFPSGAIYISESGADARVNTPYSDRLLIANNSFTNNWTGVVLWENSNRFCGSTSDPSDSCTLVDTGQFDFQTCNQQNLALGSPSQSPDYYDNCRWKTQNVQVENNSFSYNTTVITNAVPLPLPTAQGGQTLNPVPVNTCDSSHGCGYNGVFSEACLNTPAHTITNVTTTLGSTTITTTAAGGFSSLAAGQYSGIVVDGTGAAGSGAIPLATQGQWEYISSISGTGSNTATLASTGAPLAAAATKSISGTDTIYVEPNNGIGWSPYCSNNKVGTSGAQGANTIAAAITSSGGTTDPQNNLFCGNSYTYNGNSAANYMVFLQGQTATFAQWQRNYGYDTLGGCPVAATAGAEIPPPSWTAQNGQVEPIDPNGCTDGVDSTVGLYNWLNSLPQGTIANPTIVDFPRSACYQVNGEIPLVGFQNFHYDGGEFVEKTTAQGQLTYISNTGSYQAYASAVTMTFGSPVATSSSGFTSIGPGALIDNPVNRVPSGTTVVAVCGAASPCTSSSTGVNGCRTPNQNTSTFPLCTSITMSNNSTCPSASSPCTGLSMTFGQWSDPYGAFACSPTSTAGSCSTNANTGQAVCNPSGTGNITAGNPGGTYALANFTNPNQGESNTSYGTDLLFFVDGGCNDSFSNMVVLGPNQTGGSYIWQDTFISFAGTINGLVSGTRMDGPEGDCVDSQGLHDYAPGAGGNYPATNITAEYNLCANAGRDDMSVIVANKINYSNNMLYWPGGDAALIDVEYDGVCQGLSPANDLMFNNNTILTSLQATNNGTQNALGLQTDSPTARVSFSGNNITGEMKLIINALDVTYPNGNPNNCPDPGLWGPGVVSDATVANNTYSVASAPIVVDGAQPVTPPALSLSGPLGPLYVYGNNGPTTSGHNYVVAPDFQSDPICSAWPTAPATGPCPSGMSSWVSNNIITSGCGTTGSPTCTIDNGVSSTNCQNSDTFSHHSNGMYLDTACSPSTNPSPPVLPAIATLPPNTTPSQLAYIGNLPCIPGYVGVLTCNTS